ncbi:NADH:ubiquinone oxidoreductase subunit 2 [Coleophoma cylindrospora]|uniref:NADH:ubiquinone oxidoreductase subunit 2 n=1 Tax=Coleophoma cylindrospora TaxID=1849047 RepID=A0A3D8RBE2_9HELO|nr:NADH:ubiquinone oxidoreductase subunit 2 [Coleophoma cylindrospora]
MAGHNHSVAMDPAMVKYNNMAVNRFKYFRWTKRTAGITFAYAVAVPAVVGVLAYMTDGKYNLRGKRRGDTIVEF